MKKRTNTILLILFFLTFFYGNAYGDSGRFAVAGKVGTLGGGVELLAKLSPGVNFRVGGNAFDYKYAATEDDIEYDFDLNLSSISAILDWHPFKGGFRFSAGILSNGNDVEMKAKTTETYTIGDTTYSGDEVGTLTGEVGFESVAPYLGFGWGNAFGGGKRVGIVFDVGIVFQGTPKVDLSADGLLASDSEFLKNLTSEEQDLQDELDDFKYYPVISLGMTYRF